MFAPKFDAAGLVTAVVTDSGSGDVLMVAHMNAEALRKTIETGEAHYFSRSRNKLWRKGETSGHTQHVVEMRVDCDQDAIWIDVVQQGHGACHTGRRSCFYRAVPLGKVGAVALEFMEDERAFEAGKVYPRSKELVCKCGAVYEVKAGNRAREKAFKCILCDNELVPEDNFLPDVANLSLRRPDDGR